MNWIRENKFLSGFIGVMVVGAAVLGYLLYSAWGSYSDVSDQYTQAASDLNKLLHRDPFPSQANLAKYKQERDGFIDNTHALAVKLAQMSLPVEDLTPSAFQDRLRDVSADLKNKAGTGKIKLPDGFALDFNQYETQPPPAAAAGPLGRQLNALQIAMNILVDDHVDAVVDLKRTKLPQEATGPVRGGGGGFGGGGGGGGGGGPGGGRQGRGGGGPGGGGGGGTGPGVEKVSFDLKFTASQVVFQKVLNDFASSAKQFFITRTLVIENTGSKPVSKTDEGAPPPTDNSAAGGNFLKFVVGTEKLNVAMRVDMVVFNPPGKPGLAGAAPSH